MNANYLLFGSLVWYAVLAVAFASQQNYGKTLYFTGVFIFTVGVYIFVLME